jgi:hypothetical protein
MNVTKELKRVEPKEQRIVYSADFGKLYQVVRGGQVMAPVKAEMTLYEKLGHIYNIQGKYTIASQGYIHLNKVASVSIVTPQSVVVDGRPCPNPHIERDPKTKAILSVNIRKMGIGLSPAGNIVVIDKTLFYNVYTYLIQSIQAKMKRVKYENGKKTDKKEHPDCAIYGVADQKPNKPGSWHFLPTEGELGIWINYEDQAIIDCLEEHTQRQRFGDRIAQKIVERNILKDHPAIGIAQVYVPEIPKGQESKGAIATVTVYGYRNELEPHNIAEIMRAAEKGQESENFDYKVLKEEIIEAEPEEEKAELQNVAGDEVEPGTLFQGGQK